ncbi:jg7135 [Pararge aegeria aegeria]|uniref:Jg7135 protein n=1 Tax=Pararge aegeria aegeria TaxID=348720 RepID=A0A8S4SB25_9NEOP|nr:jg7135 [Pararge aegeria aegeria]
MAWVMRTKKGPVRSRISRHNGELRTQVDSYQLGITLTSKRAMVWESERRESGQIERGAEALLMLAVICCVGLAIEILACMLMGPLLCYLMG